MSNKIEFLKDKELYSYLDRKNLRLYYETGKFNFI